MIIGRKKLQENPFDTGMREKERSKEQGQRKEVGETNKEDVRRGSKSRKIENNGIET